MADTQDVLWIGGTSGAGKSTVSRLLARRHGLRCYSTDTATWDHRDRAIAAGDPNAVVWDGLGDDRRRALTPAELVGLDLDRSRWVRADVERLPSQPPAVVEGTEITPGWLPPGAMAFWLTAEPATRVARRTLRGWGAGGGEADLLRANRLEDELTTFGGTRIDTTPFGSAGQVVRVIEGAAAGWLAGHPGAVDPATRRRLRRELNMALVEQHRSGWRYHGRAPDRGVVRALECECSHPGCTDFVHVRIADLPQPFDASAAPLLSHGDPGR